MLNVSINVMDTIYLLNRSSLWEMKHCFLFSDFLIFYIDFVTFS
jgi:hypothetical protein